MAKDKQPPQLKSWVSKREGRQIQKFIRKLMKMMVMLMRMITWVITSVKALKTQMDWCTRR